MLVRNNRLSKMVMEKFSINTFIYSQWEGYLNKNNKEYELIQKFVPNDYIYLHTSGHADAKAIKDVCQITAPKILIPIHGENPEAFEKMRIRGL